MEKAKLVTDEARGTMTLRVSQLAAQIKERVYSRCCGDKASAVATGIEGLVSASHTTRHHGFRASHLCSGGCSFF